MVDTFRLEYKTFMCEGKTHLLEILDYMWSHAEGFGGVFPYIMISLLSFRRLGCLFYDQEVYLLFDQVFYELPTVFVQTCSIRKSIAALNSNTYKNNF